jgi:HNH endonuclease
MAHPRSSDPVSRFYERILYAENGCWLWQGKISSSGYALLSIKGRYVHVHRWAYEHFRGVIPEGLLIDHLCKHRSCVNPEHLQPVTYQENNQRARTHCWQGHPFTAENTLINGSGRMCRICRHERERKYRQRSAQYRQPMREGGERGTLTRNILVVVSDNVAWRQALEQLKQQGLILDFEL